MQDFHAARAQRVLARDGHRHRSPRFVVRDRGHRLTTNSGDPGSDFAVEADLAIPREKADAALDEGDALLGVPRQSHSTPRPLYEHVAIRKRAWPIATTHLQDSRAASPIADVHTQVVENVQFRGGFLAPLDIDRHG